MDKRLSLEILKREIKHTENVISGLQDNLIEMKKMFQELCEHKNIKFEPSFTLYEYMGRPEHFKASFTCKECSVYYKDGDMDFNSYNQQLLNSYKKRFCCV